MTPAMIPSEMPLARFPLFAGVGLDEARSRVAQVYCDHRLEPLGRDAVLASHNRLIGRVLSLNVMTYGTRTLIAPGKLEDFYLFQFPLSGGASVRNGALDYEIGQGRAAVLNPDAETCMIWSEACVQVMLQVPRRALADLARQHYGMPAGRSLRFTAPRDMAGTTLAGLISHALGEAAQGRSLLGEGLARQCFEQALMGALLEEMPHDLETPCARGPAPRAVRQAEAFLRAHLGEELTLDTVARAVGVSPRALQGAFRTAGLPPPMAMLRDLRLERAWGLLSAPQPETTVTDVATELGVFHLGRFAAQYRQKFGCTPVETLRQARGGTLHS